MQSNPQQTSSETINSPQSSTQSVLESTFANDPLVNLLRLRKDKPILSEEERRAATLELRRLRTSPQALGRTLRQEAAEDAAKPAPVKQKAVKDEARDLYGDLGL